MGLTKPRAHQLQGSDYKASVRVVSTSNVNLSGGAPTSVDGVTLVANDRVLVTGQSTGSQNGIYRVKTLGTGSNGTWVRSKDADTNDDVTAGIVIMVTEGSSNADMGSFICSCRTVMLRERARRFHCLVQTQAEAIPQSIALVE